MNWDKRKIIVTLLSIGMMILLVVNVLTYFKMAGLQDQISDLNGNFMSINSSVNSNIGSSINRMETLLDQQTSIVSNFSFEATGLNKEEKNIGFLLKATPKEYKENMKVEFLCTGNDGIKQVYEAVKGEGYEYTVPITVSALQKEDVAVGIVLDYGDMKKMQDLDTIYDAMGKYRVGLNTPTFSGSYSYRNGKAEFDISVNAECYNMGENTVKYHSSKITDIHFFALVNGKEVLRKKMMLPEELVIENMGDTAYSCLVKKEFSMKKGDTLIFKVIAKDNNGLTYTGKMNEFIITPDNQMEEVLVEGAPNEMTISF